MAYQFQGEKMSKSRIYYGKKDCEVLSTFIYRELLSLQFPNLSKFLTDLNEFRIVTQLVDYNRQIIIEVLFPNSLIRYRLQNPCPKSPQEITNFIRKKLYKTLLGLEEGGRR